MISAAASCATQSILVVPGKQPNESLHQVSMSGNISHVMWAASRAPARAGRPSETVSTPFDFWSSDSSASFKFAQDAKHHGSTTLYVDEEAGRVGQTQATHLFG